MKIGQLAQRSGIAAHTIRFYEAEGLLPKAKRGMNGYRDYQEEALEHLLVIQSAKNLGFSLDDIQSLFKEQTANRVDHAKILSHLDKRLADIDQMLVTLAAQKSDILQFKETLQMTWSEGRCLKFKDVAGLNMNNT